MALHFSGGTGILIDKESELQICKVDYQLMETEATKYNQKRWWGEFDCAKKIEKSGTFRIDLEDGRKGDCVVWSESDAEQAKSSHYVYHFNGRGKLGRDKR
jgi:hypothetical protein